MIAQWLVTSQLREIDLNEAGGSDAIIEVEYDGPTGSCRTTIEAIYPVAGCAGEYRAVTHTGREVIIQRVSGGYLLGFGTERPVKQAMLRTALQPSMAHTTEFSESGSDGEEHRSAASFTAAYNKSMAFTMYGGLIVLMLLVGLGRTALLCAMLWPMFCMFRLALFHMDPGMDPAKRDSARFNLFRSSMGFIAVAAVVIISAATQQSTGVTFLILTGLLGMVVYVGKGMNWMGEH